ncbi:hypothetical protein SBOR_9088 [Sclerotinia borealis F-4128]|uniref:Uncharacterized protein n=1 Tax=Sclerotinia borealis (strain F-4128) TaxID=1432307 RepID=W9C6I8_SCLBF|nr:hypothetical protein SBOR_9088 [Sclerotinia borealis F-4128]
MASPKTSTTRRVLGDINININTSALEIHYASSMAKIQQASYDIESTRTTLNLSEVVGNSTTEIRRENREATDTDLQVGGCLEEGKLEERISSQNMEKESGDTRTTTSVHLSNAEPNRLAGKKRYLLANVDVAEVSEAEARRETGKKAKTETHQASIKSSLQVAISVTSPRQNLFPCNKAIQDETGWKEGCPRVYGDVYGNENTPRTSHKVLRRASQIKSSSSVTASPSSSFPSTGDAEDTAITTDNSQVTETSTPDDSVFTSTNVITPKSFRTSTFEPLSRDEIRQQSQALRLRLSLANYKVKTNQIDLPLSRLEIRSTTPKLLSSAPLRTNPSVGISISSRTPLPGAPIMKACTRALVPAINIQRPSPSSRNGRAFVRDEREKDRGKNVDIPSSPPISGRDSLSRRDSAISCTSLGSNSGSGSASGHAHPMTTNINTNTKEKTRDTEINMEKEVARRRQEVMRGKGKENVLSEHKKPMSESQKLGLANPPLMFAQSEMEMESNERGRSPELSRKAADGLLRLSLLR